MVSETCFLEGNYCRFAAWCPELVLYQIIIALFFRRFAISQYRCGDFAAAAVAAARHNDDKTSRGDGVHDGCSQWSDENQFNLAFHIMYSDDCLSTCHFATPIQLAFHIMQFSPSASCGATCMQLAACKFEPYLHPDCAMLLATLSHICIPILHVVGGYCKS